MDIPETEQEAREHIAQIRRAKGLGSSESNTTDLGNALVILSEQLYQKSTHFLSELIQNADDNTYMASTPTLNITFTYNNKTLRIDCNEVGFGRSNVEAICKIGRSTKASMGNSTRYIGEKGIGFKSVFKVADVVYISSGPYSFKFDKKEELGMIAPIWTEFPDFRLPQNTSLLLQLAGEYDTSELEDELKSLDPRLLMFLRKLKQVNVICYGKFGKIWRSTLGRHDAPPSLEGASRINLHHDASFSSSEVIRVPVYDMPPDPKRLGCNASEILLAFPVRPDGQPWIAPQKVYAFLPIRDHGFRFLLQADFLLIASREDIDVSSPWNRRLLVKIPEAFLEAVQTLNKGDLRYSWIRYMSDRVPLSDFFEHLESGIRHTLSRAEIMESLSGQVSTPKKLKFVPQEFRDAQGLPLIQTDRTKKKYLSHKYSMDDKNPILLLGCQQLSASEFIDDLRAFISVSPETFQAMSRVWHTSLAEALIQVIHRDPQTKATVDKLAIIPLKDGIWVASSDKQTCFAATTEILKIPRGIDVGEIEPEAASEVARRTLFIYLGAKTYSKDLICDAIVDAQSKVGFDASALDPEDLISQAVFLYKSRWKNSGVYDLWVATDDGSVKRGSETYIDSLQPNSASVLFPRPECRLSFLHSGYKDAVIAIDGSWMTWLCEHLLIAEYPRLVLSLSPKLVLAKDFRMLMEEGDPLRLLLLLRDRWESYSERFVAEEDSDPETVRSRTKLREKITALMVPCQGGGTSPLGQTVLPLTGIISEEMDSTTFIQVPMPEDVRWKFLRYFGVTVDPGVSQYIQYLRQMKKTGGSIKRVSEIFKQIHVHAVTHQEEIKKTFETEDLIFFPSPRTQDKGTWVRSSICVWQGPRWLRKTPCLKDSYSADLYPFFWFTLGVQNATWKTVIDEAEFMDASDDVDYISEVFKAINDCLEENKGSGTIADIVKCLKDAPIFPINAGKSGCIFDYMSSAQDLDMWFIADRWHLKTSFDGLVPLLALNVDVVEKITLTIQLLGLHDRLLSQAAGANAEVSGPTQPHQIFTSSLRSKARPIARILPKEHPTRAEVILQLCNLNVYTSEEVVVQWSVKMGTGEVLGRADSGRVKISHKGKTMNIYLRQRDADAGHIPLELRERLARFCALDDATQSRLLDFILSEQDLDEIENELSRRGFPISVPEFDDASIEASILPEDWRTQPSKRAVDSRRRFCGRKPNPRRHQKRLVASNMPDSVQTFLDKFNLASSFQTQLSRPWAEAEADQMLSHLCRMENIDPWMLLAQNRSKLDNVLKSKDQAPGTVTGVHWNTERDIHHKGQLLKTSNSFPATVYQDSRRNIRIAVSTAVQNVVEDDMLFATELYVSRALEKQLGVAFVPEIHWTSPLRSKAGLLPFHDSDRTSSTFTIDDVHGAFSNLLVANGHKKASSWRLSPTFHVEVVPSDGDLSETFCLDPNQVHQAWRCHLAMSSSSPNEVYILARVVNVRSQPEIVFFVDPWRLHAEGLLSLQSISQHEACLSRTVNGISIKGPENDIPGRKAQEKSSRSLFHRRKPSRNTPSPQPSESLYLYTRLQFDETRIFELFPAHDDGPLCGEVHHMNLSKAQHYVALSYVWGPAMKQYQLKTSQGDIPLTMSLNAALRRLRKSDESVWIWADAISINQNDDHEKAIQIRQLPRIFHSAEVVLGWIGDESENSHRAIETLLQIRTLEISPTDWPDELPDIPDTWVNGVPPPDDEIWWAIRDLFKREWFSRVWVIQEVVQAYELRVICGDFEVEWDDIVKAVEICLDNNAELLQADSYLRQILPSLRPAYTLGLTRRAFVDTRLSSRFNLLSLLDSFQYARSTKECDKLFAMLGISCDSSDTVLDPDYSSSLEEVVRRYSAEFVRRGNALDMLYRAGTAKCYDFSSWIPRWTGNEPCRTISTWRGTEGVFAAASSTHPQASISRQNARVLMVAGMHVDTVSKISSVSMEDREIITVVNDAHILIDELAVYPTGEALATVKLKAPIGSAVAPCTDDVVSIENIKDSLDGQVDADAELESAFDWDESFTAVHCVRDIVSLLQQPKHKREKSWNYWTTAATFMKRLSDGRFFVTDRGYVGVGPPETNVGQRIVVFHGGAVPFLVKGDSSATRLVGEAYVHGIMYGEGLELKGTREAVITLV